MGWFKSAPRPWKETHTRVARQLLEPFCFKLDHYRLHRYFPGGAVTLVVTELLPSLRHYCFIKGQRANRVITLHEERWGLKAPLLITVAEPCLHMPPTVHLHSSGTWHPWGGLWPQTHLPTASVVFMCQVFMEPQSQGSRSSRGLALAAGNLPRTFLPLLLPITEPFPRQL